MKSIIQKTLLILCILSLGLFLFSGLKVSSAEEVVYTDGVPVKRFGSNDSVTVKEFKTKDTEFRAVWVSPLVGDIARYSSKAQYQEQILSVLDSMQYYNLNVMLFHVRIMNDSLYPSAYSDWSIYYDTNPDWDALPWIIEECHKRGIEFHAWMNPYRVQNGTYNLRELAKKYRSSNMASNYENLLQGTNSVILNPGEPAVRDWLVRVCMEVVENYDVDAIHFDDYFYDAGIDDSATQAKYRPSTMSVSDWRREQVSTFIHDLSNAIRAYNAENNRRVELGISPSGVWKADTNRNNGFGTVTLNAQTGMVETEGSRTSQSSFQHYDYYLYSDTLYWINKEWIDYIIPQTYWAMNHPNCPYADLMDWWNEVCSYKNVRCYSGMGLYLHDSTGGYGWYTSDKEAYNQVRYCNGLDNVDGYSFFAYTDIKQAVRNPQMASGLKGLFSNIAILPEINTQNHIIPSRIENLKVEKTEAGYKLSFKADEEAKFYVIYRTSVDAEEVTAEDVIAIIGDLSVDGVIEYLDENSNARSEYKYSVRKQSYSRTLGPISKVSTVGSTVGELVNLGEIEKFNITKETNSLSCFFGDMTYSYGGKMNYKINYKFDDGEEKTVSTFQRRNGYNYASISIPNGASTATVRLEVSNNIGFTSKTISLNLVSTLPEVTNFIVLPIGNYVLYNNQKAEFIWNNLNIEGAKYTIQESSDSFIWDDLDEISNSTNVFNIKKEVLLSNKSGTMYYRIKIEKETEVNYSSVYQIQVYDFLDEIKNIRLNGTRFKQTTNVSEGDEFTLSWGIIPDADYRVLVSSDGTGWTSVLSYSSKASIEKSGTTASTKIEFNYKYMHLLLKIEASLNGKYTYSDIFEFYVTVDDLYADDVVNYFMKEYKLFLSDMGIYNGK